MTHEFKSDPVVFHQLVSMRTQRDAPFNAEHLRWIDRSVGYSMYHILTNDLEAPTGYVIWAYVNDATIRRLWNYKRLPAYGYEWSEGVITLILDVVYISPGDRLPFALLRSAFPRDIDRVAFLRRDRVRLYRCSGAGIRSVGLDQFVWPLSPRPASPSAVLEPRLAEDPLPAVLPQRRSA